MTDKGPGSGAEWIDGDVLNSDDLLDSMSEMNWLPIANQGRPNSGVVAFTRTTWSGVDTAGDIYTSTNSGSTWTSKNTTPNAPGYIRLAKNDRTDAFFCENSATSETAITTDSGATWTSKTSATFGTAVYDMSFPTSSLIVIAGDDGGGGNHIVYSNDSGATWNDPTTPPGAAIYAVDFFDASTGYAVDSSGNIYKTTDGGDNWTDTTDNLSGASAGDSILVLTANTFIAVSNSTNYSVATYDNSTNTVTDKVDFGAEQDIVLGIGQIDNGDVVVGLTDSATNAVVTLLKSSDSGVTWSLIQEQSYSLSAVNDNKTRLSCYSEGFIFNSTLLRRIGLRD